MYITCIFYFWLTTTVSGDKWPSTAERRSASTVTQTELCWTFLSKKIGNCSLVTCIGMAYLSWSQQSPQPLRQYRGRPEICGLLLCVHTPPKMKHLQQQPGHHCCSTSPVAPGNMECFCLKLWDGNSSSFSAQVKRELQKGFGQSRHEEHLRKLHRTV